MDQKLIHWRDLWILSIENVLNWIYKIFVILLGMKNPLYGKIMWWATFDTSVIVTEPTLPHTWAADEQKESNSFRHVFTVSWDKLLYVLFYEN